MPHNAACADLGKPGRDLTRGGVALGLLSPTRVGIARDKYARYSSVLKLSESKYRKEDKENKRKQKRPVSSLHCLG